MTNPWGIWCEFVWVFCFLIPLIIWIAEAMSVHILLKLFLPDWDDLVCGLTMICMLMISSATVVYAAIFACYTCVLSIITVTASAVATLFFLLDAVLQNCKCPDGYLSRLRGAMRITEAFVACILLTAASNHFLYVDSFYRPASMMWALFVVTVCLLANLVVILFNFCDVPAQVAAHALAGASVQLCGHSAVPVCRSPLAGVCLLPHLSPR